MGAANIPDKIERVATGDLVPYAKNARTHSEKQVEHLAASMREFGWTNPVLIDERGGIIAGHGRVMAARLLGMESVPCIRLSHLDDNQKRALVLADNKLAELAGWDDALLAEELRALEAAHFQMDLLGFSDKELGDLLEETRSGGSTADDLPEVRAGTTPVVLPGEVWRLGRHRVMCGDSRSPEHFALLMDGERAPLIHADPPYGMGKQNEGVENDNIYGAKLDAFQMQWWRTVRPHLTDNASAYIWGNAPDLWRLWYVGGLGTSEVFELRNEIVWDKKTIAGMASPDLTQYPEATERCLFFQFGKQFIGNINADDFPESWEPLRAYMEEQANAAGIAPADVKRVCGVGMFGHWFTRSQFFLIPEKHYEALRAAYPGHFARAWSELKAEWARVRGTPRDLREGQGIARSYFNNGHAIMRDVWEHERVTGEDRHGHATPKPVAMMIAILKSSLPAGGLVVEPFGGSGSTLIGAESSDRRCYTMELQPVFCDTIIRRWQKYTGEHATLEGDGRRFDQIEVARRA